MAKPGDPLSRRQQAVYDLRAVGKNNKEIAALLGVGVQGVANTVHQVKLKMGEKGVPRVVPGPRPVEWVNPEGAAAVIDAASDPAAKMLRIKEVAEREGMPLRLTQAILKRLSSRFLGTKSELRDLKTNELLRMVNERLDLTMGWMDDVTASQASHRDLGLVAAALIEKRQLLRGEPTQIISDHERKKLNELLPELVREAQRRGITFEGQVLEKTIEPARTEA